MEGAVEKTIKSMHAPGCEVLLGEFCVFNFNTEKFNLEINSYKTQ